MIVAMTMTLRFAGEPEDDIGTSEQTLLRGVPVVEVGIGQGVKNAPVLFWCEAGKSKPDKVLLSRVLELRLT